MLAVISEKLRTLLPALHWEAHDDSRFLVLLCRATLLRKHPGKSIRLSLVAVHSRSPINFGEVARNEGLLTMAAHGDPGVGVRKVPLVSMGSGLGASNRFLPLAAGCVRSIHIKARINSLHADEFPFR